jgi:hypothetical protein
LQAGDRLLQALEVGVGNGIFFEKDYNRIELFITS